MRRDVLRLIEAFPGCTQTQISAFMGADAKSYIDVLVAEGIVEETTRRDGLPGRPARRLKAARAAETINIAERHSEAYAEAKLRATRWVLALHGDAEAQAMLVELLSAPAEWAAERSLVDLMGRCGLASGGRGWMRPARRLEEMGVVALRERRGAGRDTTVRLLDPPPYPLG